MNRVEKLCNIFFKILVLIVCCYALCHGIFHSVVIVRNGVRFNSSYIDVTAIIATVIILWLLRFIKKMDNKLLKFTKILLSLIPLITLFVTLNISFYHPNDDAMICIDLANQLFESIKYGNLPIVDFYVERTPHQIGLIIFEASLMLVSREYFDFIFFLTNLCSLIGIYLYLYKIVKLWNFDTEVTYLILISLWIVPLLLTKFYYGWNIGLFLAIISIYNFIHFLEVNKFNYIIISIIFLFFGCFIKPNFSIIYVAYLITLTLKKFNGKVWMLLSVLSVFLISTNICPFLVKNIYKDSTRSAVPMTGWLVMGSQESNWGNGWFNGYVNEVFATCNGNKQLMQEKINSDLENIIIKRLSHPMQTVNFYVNKLNDLVLNKDFQVHSYYVMGDNELNKNELLINNPGLSISYFINELSFMLILIGTIVYEFKTLLCNDNRNALLELCYLGGLSYHLLFEAKGIYMFPWFTMLLPLASIGLLSFTTIPSKRVKLYSITSITIIVVVCFFANIYNPKNYQRVFFENYSNNKDLLSLSQGNYIEQNFMVNEDRIVSRIDICTNGYIPEKGIIGLEIYNADNLLFERYYDISVLTDYGWSSFYIDNLFIKANENYVIKIYSNIDDKDFSLIIGEPSSENTEGLTINGFKQKSVINFKLSEPYKQEETVSYIFDIYFNNY